MKKIILGVIALAVVVVAGGAYFLLSNLDSLVKKAIETAGSEVAGVKVEVASVKISLTEGKGAISGLKIGNPAGFQTPYAISLGEITLALDTGSITKNPVVISQILVGAPEVSYELSPNGGSNIQTIQSNVQAYTAKGKPAADKSADKSAPGGDKPATKVVVDKVDIANGKVTLASPVPGVKGSGVLPDIHLTNLGRDSGGATPGQIAEKVIAALTKSAINAGASLGVGAQLDAVKGAIGGATSGQGAGKAVDGLKGLIGK